MDLFAYAQMGNLEPIMEPNGIKDIKRLRGLRLMQFEKPLSVEEIDKIVYTQTKYSLEALFAWDPKYKCWCYDDRSSLYASWFLYKNGQPRWDRIHGKLRKAVKFEIKKTKRKVYKQYEIYNKYCGREDVLYIHTRTGGNNWNYFGCNEYLSKPWYLEHVDDSFDSTYCDIYAKIDPELTKSIIEEIQAENDAWDKGIQKVTAVEQPSFTIPYEKRILVKPDGTVLESKTELENKKEEIE